MEWAGPPIRQVRLKVRSRAKFPREFKSISARFRSEKNVIYGVRMSSRTRERCLSASISAGGRITPHKSTPQTMSAETVVHGPSTAALPQPDPDAATQLRFGASARV
jgi:hypothetical protein